MTAKREDSFGSLDNLASAGRSTSRSNLIPTASADDILDKLKALNYQQEFFAELKKLGIPFEYGPTKLKQAYGEACIYVLQSLVDMAITKLKIQFRSPVHRLDDYPEEAEVDHDAEITTEAVEEEIEANQEEDEAFTFALGKVNKTDDIIEYSPAQPI
ncbi:Intraflagellar transport protein 57 [Kappamyces sp. JEL0680]|nr:Intraflagellar transport protein 57 [Kappamyces sp. JEL0680]